MIDAGQIQQVLTNLFMNAWHAMPRGGLLTVRLSEPSEGQSVQVHIRDTGCGIPESDRELIFEPFFTTKEVGVGTGLGLSIVQGIIEEHGGQILLDSQVGVGTCFTLVLPTATHEETNS
jgi:signal transduction histidine kinase